MSARRKRLLLIATLCAWGGLIAFSPASVWAAPQMVFAQAAETENASEPLTEPAPTSLPHGKFLLDYLLVAALLAGALYAVCRSSRRV